MASGRLLLAAVALGVASADCLKDIGLTRTGYLHERVVEVAWQHRGRRHQDEIVWAVSDGRPGGAGDRVHDVRLRGDEAGGGSPI